MHINAIKLKNFRCFDDQYFDLNGKFVVIHGNNGAGKTSLLEALYYSCYLRSFRTSQAKDLVNLERDFFFISLDFYQDDQAFCENIQIGYSEKNGKLVKLNNKQIQSYKDLISYYKLISLNADDNQLVSGSPSLRRDFLNYAMVLSMPSILQKLKLHRQVLAQRNSLLEEGRFIQKGTSHFDQLIVWTKELWQLAREIQQARREYLVTLEDTINSLLEKHVAGSDKGLRVTLQYSAKDMPNKDDFEAFWPHYEKYLFEREKRMARSLFGCHLDDFMITFQQKKARIFASRGQQKLITFLLKIAQIEQSHTTSERWIFLVDDFLTDLDAQRIEQCVSILSTLNVQTFITTPTSPTELYSSFQTKNKCLIEI